MIKQMGRLQLSRVADFMQFYANYSITLGVFGVGVAPLWTPAKFLPPRWYYDVICRHYAGNVSAAELMDRMRKKIFVANFGLLFNFTVVYED